MLSRVVPGSSLAMTRSSPSRRLTRVDLPTFGRPMTAMRMAPESSRLRRCGVKPSSTCSISVSQPCPWLAEMASGGPRPSRWKSAPARSGSSPSALLSTSVTGLPARRSSRATNTSCGESPARASASNISRSASCTARSVCARICAAIPTGFSTSPPVSITTQGTGPSRPKPYCRSRVSPGTSATMASRVPVSTLNRVDLPTFGRPTSAMTGSMRGALRCAAHAATCPAHCPRQPARRQPVRRQPVRRQPVGAAGGWQPVRTRRRPAAGFAPPPAAA